MPPYGYLNETRHVGFGLGGVAITAVLTVALTITFGLAASVGRGYLPGVLAMFVVLFTARSVSALVPPRRLARRPVGTLV